MNENRIKKLKCEDCLKVGTYVVNRDKTMYICTKCGNEKIIYSKEELVHIEKAIFSLANLVDDIDSVECRCDIETVICMRCELLDRLEAVRNDIIDMME